MCIRDSLLIGHLNKAAGMQSLQRGLGSIDIAAAVRSVMFIGKLKHDPTMRILTHEKSSLAPPGASLAFSLGDEGGFRWVGEYDITADEMLSGIEPQRETKTQQAKDQMCIRDSSIIMPSITSPLSNFFSSSSRIRFACACEGEDCWLSMATAI